MTYLNNPDDLKSLANNFILTLYRDRDGTLFIGTLNGLSIFDAKTQQFTNFYHDPKNSNSLSGSRIRSIFQDSKGIYWVGTDDGLSRWDRGINMFQRITKNDGLPNNVVYGVLEDDHGRYWISTNRGLSRMTADASHHYSFRNYDVDDGLQSREFNTNSFLKSEDGEMYFGGVNGLNIFHPDSVRDNLNLAPIVLTGFNTNGSHYQMDESICFCKAIEISYKENYFSLEFASLDYANPEKNQYAYKMDGFEEDWTYSGNRRFVSYTNLEPGTYTFHVKGTNSDGLWNEVGASVVITITPPFWKTWWFRLMTLLAIVGSIVSMHKVRTRSIKTQKRKLEQEVIQRTKEINQQKEILVEQNDQLIGQSREIEAQRDTLQQINGQLELAIVNLKNAEAQLIQAEKMASLGQMVAGITHEINNPLSFIDSNLPFFEDYSKRYAAIIGEIELHLGAHASNGMQKELERIKEKYEFALINRDTLDIVNSCRHGSKRIKQIVDDLRQFSRLDESGTKQTNLNDCLDTTLTLLENQYSDRIEVHREYGKLPLVECYPAKLNQVFLNILTNAIQAVSSGGVVEVATEVQGDWAIVRIKDNGQGMTEAIKHKIFDPFFTTKDVGKGTGLGLSIAYGIIKEHNGNIDVESQPGTGSTFVIRIPILFNGLGKFNARNN